MKKPSNSILKLSATVALVALVSLALASCGGGSSSTTGGDSSGEGSQEASSEFLRPKGENNKYVTFGDEASSEVREEATAALSKNLEAREAGDFATQCATLSLSQAEQLTGKKGAAAVSGCTKALKKLAEPLSNSKPQRINTLKQGSIAALRVKGNEAFAFYHGPSNLDYMMPLLREDGQWKVAAIVTVRLGAGKS